MYWKKIDIFFAGSTIGFTLKKVVDEDSVRKKRNYAKLLLGLMVAKYTHTGCVNSCTPTFPRVAISVPRTLTLHRGKKLVVSSNR